MATPNPQYVVAPSLEMYFVDKDTGAPLSSGLITFYSDVERNVKKTIYTQTLVGGDYTYVPLANPVVLSSVGTFQDDNGNNIVPYYFPFDENGDEELYYITVYSSLDGIVPAVLQFTREAWPPPEIGQVSPDTVNAFENQIPNGQFLSHNNIPVTNTTSAGQITQAVTNIAQGGWTFERDNVSTATDFVTFSRFSSSITNPTGNPRYAIRIRNSVIGSGNTYKRLCVAFRDVNKFSSSDNSFDGPQTYTFSFSAAATMGGSVTLNINELQNFGTGGTPSAQNTIPVGSPIIISSVNYDIVNVPIIFPETTGFTIGTNNDDTVQIAIYLPISSTFDISFTDFILTIGNLNITGFIDETNADMLSRGVAGWMPTPDPDGMDLYLPLRLTPTGLQFDRGVVGDVISSIRSTASIGELPMDGTSYQTNLFSSDGIPYRRLFNVLFNNSINGTKWGGGPSFSNTTINSGSTAQLILTANLSGANTAPSNGSSSPAFTYGQPIAGSASINYNAYSNSIGVVTAISTFLNGTNGPVEASAGTSGMVITTSHLPSNQDYYYIFSFQALSAATLANPGGNGKYFTFSNHTNDYFVWFKVTTGVNVETIPPAGGTAILVNLQTANITSASAIEVGNIIAAAINRRQVDVVNVGAASGIISGSYFIFNTNNNTAIYNVWYNKNGAGGAPVLTNLIEVDISTGQTAIQVAAATQAAINSFQYYIPNTAGLFMRGADSNQQWDIDSAARYAFYSALPGNGAGSFELDQIYAHLHLPGASNFASGAGAVLANNAGANVGSTFATTAVTGGTESRPVNMSVNWYIKY